MSNRKILGIAGTSSIAITGNLYTSLVVSMRSNSLQG